MSSQVISDIQTRSEGDTLLSKANAVLLVERKDFEKSLRNHVEGSNCNEIFS